MERDWKFSHIGMFVRDLAKTVEYLRSLGIFTIPAAEPIVLEGKNPDRPGAAGTILRLDVTCGDLCIEILQPVSGDNLQQRWLDAHGEGVSHVCFDVPDIAHARTQMAAKGVPVACHIRETTTYYNTGEQGNMLLELRQVT
jgi:methylmalonyl-CoA/ethylmalonyl-CoA epimerase